MIKFKKPQMPMFVDWECVETTKSGEEKVIEIVVAVSHMSKQMAEEYAELMKQTFLNHWENQTKKWIT